MNFLGGAFPIGRIFGITIRVHVLFVLWIAFRLISAGSDWQFEAKFYALLFGIVLLHELGHCLGARAVGGDARDILMWPLGGLAYAQAPMRPWPQFVTVAAGPAVNVVLCLISAGVIFAATGGAVLPSVNPLSQSGYYVIGELSRMPPEWLGYVDLFYRVNLFLLAFNLLPIFPLDGGQLFQTIIWPFVGLQRATLVACQVGLVGCVVFGLYSLRGGGGILLFIAIFGAMTCWQRYQAARHGWVMEDPVYAVSQPRRRSFWRRLLGGHGGGTPGDARPRRRVEMDVNPNPGGWEARQAEHENEEAELDRLLKKVHDQGIQSLSYVERQRLERITRERREREEEYERGNRL